MKKNNFKEQNRTLAREMLEMARKGNEEERKDTKSVRMNLLIRPTLKEKLYKISTIERVSINELVNKALEEYTTKKQEKIEKYNSIYEEK